MQYLDHKALKGAPHLMIDGGALPGTALTLSHWPGSGTPWPLKADLSSQIVFNYLKQPSFHMDVPYASNTHFDVDGLVGVWTALNPDNALPDEARLNDIASAGDFQQFEQLESLRAAKVFESIDDYVEGLARFEEVLKDLDAHKSIWAEEEAAFKKGMSAFAAGEWRCEERFPLDLSILRPKSSSSVEPSPYSLNRVAHCFGMAILTPGSPRFYYRYESWVQYVSRPIHARVELGQLAAKLTALETKGAQWGFEGIDAIAPELKPKGESTIDPEDFLKLLTEELEHPKGPRWEPWDPK